MAERSEHEIELAIERMRRRERRRELVGYWLALSLFVASLSVWFWAVPWLR